MSAREMWARRTGEWAGTNRLWLSPQDPVRESETTAAVDLGVKASFLTIRYTWADQGQPQDGVLVVRLAEPGAEIEAAWIDSWHMSDKIMHCRGDASQDGSLTVAGTYAAPPGPDWGWRIVLRPEADGAFKMLMYNILPDGQEALAVEARYSRQR